MLSLTKWIAAPALAVGLMFAADAPSAKAQFGLHIGGGHGISINTGRYNAYRPYTRSYGYGNYGHGNYGYRSNFGHNSNFGYRSNYSSRPWFHDTSHYDYHPTEAVRHGNHYDIIPGHYDYHRTGHWHH